MPGSGPGTLAARCPETAQIAFAFEVPYGVRRISIPFPAARRAKEAQNHGVGHVSRTDENIRPGHPDDSNGIESPHAHVIVPARDRDGERAFNVYRRDVQQTREVAERETERLFELSRVHDRQPELEQEKEMELGSLDREIPFFDIDL
jgi:hypothetical protein